MMTMFRVIVSALIVGRVSSASTRVSEGVVEMKRPRLT
jgi:hypothetical protein